MRKAKYMTDAHIAELDGFIEQHGEGALRAFGNDCIREYNIGCAKLTLLGGVIGCVCLGTIYVGKRVVHKIKAK